MKKYWTERRAKAPITLIRREGRRVAGTHYGPPREPWTPTIPWAPWRMRFVQRCRSFSRGRSTVGSRLLPNGARDIPRDEKALSFLRPPGLIENPQGSYISPTRAFLVLDEDGSFRTPYELMQRKDSMAALKAQITQGKRASDVLHLLWKSSEPLELRAVENLLRRLSQAIIPATPARFCAYEEPRFRAALRMQLGMTRSRRR